MAEKKKEYIIPKRSQKAIEEDPDVLLRVGVVDMPFSYKSKVELGNVKVPVKGQPLKSKVLMDGWRVYTEDLSTESGMNSAAKVRLMKLAVSRSSPNMVMRKSAGFTDDDADAVLNLLASSVVFINRSDASQFDRVSGEYIGKTANRQWFVEDMRKFRNQKVNDHEDTIEISFRLREMKSDVKKLRDTLYLIGESPSGDTAQELYFQLSNAVIDNPKSQARRNFLDFIVNPTMKPAHIEMTKLINKSVDLSIIAQDGGFYTYQGTRLGKNLTEVIQHLEYDSDILKSIKIAIANESGSEEDAQEAHSIAAPITKSDNDLKGVAWVSDHMKATGLYKLPASALKGKNTIAEAVEVFNAKAKGEGWENDRLLTVDKVLENI